MLTVCVHHGNIIWAGMSTEAFSIATMSRNAIINAELRVSKNFMIISLKIMLHGKSSRIYIELKDMVKKYCEETKM